MWGLPPENKPVQKHYFSVWGDMDALHTDMTMNKLGLDTWFEGPAESPAYIGEGTPQLFIWRRETEVAPDSGNDTFFQSCLNAIRDEGQPPNSNEDGLRLLEIQHALYRATETGKTQRLPVASN